MDQSTRSSSPPAAADGRAALLAQLKIERSDQEVRRNGWPWVAGTLAIVAAVAVGAWFWFFAPATPVVQVATAQLASADAESVRSSALDASGYVVARRQATVSAKITGNVIEVLIEEGQQVGCRRSRRTTRRRQRTSAAAQALAQLAQQRGTLEAASVAFENAEPTFARSREQFDRQVISAQAFDSAQGHLRRRAYERRRCARAASKSPRPRSRVAQRELDDTVVRAPFAGVVTVKAAQEGEMVSPISAGGGFTRTGIGTIVDMDSLEVEVDVSESFINRVKPDQEIDGHAQRVSRLEASRLT